MRTPRYLALVLLLSACTTTTDGSVATTTGAAAGAPTTTVGASPPGDEAVVVRVFDGDSLIAELEDGSEVEVRLLGINAPEGSECHGDAARDTLGQLVEAATITMVSDAEQTDQFDRLLRYLYVDGLNVNLALIANGDAIALQGDHSLDADFVDMAASAAAVDRGLWAPDACGSEPPPDSVAIVDYSYNPSGRDEDDLNGEWIAIANSGLEPIELSSWILRDESTQHRYQFPRDYVLGARAEVLVHSGCGRDSATDLYWCADDPVWSNGGDTAILQLPSGVVVSWETYRGDF
jgi:endonuclease YncB( thermonuclease family)